MFFTAQRASDVRRAESEEKLATRADELANLIRTLPPEDFLSTLGETYWRCDKMLATVRRAGADLGVPELEKTIRAVLRGIGSLAQKFDAATWGTVYAANVMLFRLPSFFREDAVADLLARLRFREREVNIHALYGVLDLDLALSAAVSGEQQENEGTLPDTELRPLALPIPALDATRGVGGKWRVLPGAPLAFVKAQQIEAPIVDLYADTSTLGKWCRDTGDFSPTVVQDLEGYFSGEAGARVRGFASLPLRRHGGDQSIIGVLNIHANRADLLRSGAGQTSTTEGTTPAAQFGFLIGPVLSILVQLVDLRSESAEAANARS